MIESVAENLLARIGYERPGLFFEDDRWTYVELVRECIVRAHLLLELRPPGPFHVGLLLENSPEFLFLAGGAALAGATIVGINPTRRGAELERDIRHTECGILVTDGQNETLVKGLETGVPPECTFDAGSDEWRERVEACRGRDTPSIEIDPSAPYLLIFTSGTTGDPKASICSQRRLAISAGALAERRKISREDVLYQTMPLFHSNALNAWIAAVAGGAPLALRRKFSASGFLPDVRKYGATVANYVGKPLTYVLATPERPDDSDNSLRLVYGNEAAPHDVERFALRFGCLVTDSYGTTEGGLYIIRTPDTPSGALGVGPPGTVILDPETNQERPAARFDDTGQLINADEAVGEIANLEAVNVFEGYWHNPDADHERTRDGIYWTGDLGYRDENGFIYFAGRGNDWMRVDGENIAAAPIERIVARHPDVAAVAVYAVPDALVGDQIMAALVMRSESEFDPQRIAEFLEEQSDLGPKAKPRYLRIAASLPMTATHKILKRDLRAQHWECEDQVWTRTDAAGYQKMTARNVDALRGEFRERGREHLLG